jgi:hypothetical protein
MMTQTTERMRTFCPISTLKKGTKTMYTDEMNPDFPALTVRSPIC